MIDCSECGVRSKLRGGGGGGVSRPGVDTTLCKNKDPNVINSCFFQFQILLKITGNSLSLNPDPEHV